MFCQHAGASRGKRPGTSLNMLRTAPIAENDLAWLSAVPRGRLTTNWGVGLPVKCSSVQPLDAVSVAAAGDAGCDHCGSFPPRHLMGMTRTNISSTGSHFSQSSSVRIFICPSINNPQMALPSCKHRNEINGQRDEQPGKGVRLKPQRPAWGQHRFRILKPLVPEKYSYS